jgi:hypothetical protein
MQNYWNQFPRFNETLHHLHIVDQLSQETSL